MCLFKKGNISNKYQSKITTWKIMYSHSIFTSSINSANHKLSLSLEEGFYCYGASLTLPIVHYYMPNLLLTKGIVDSDLSKIGKSYVNFDKEIISEDRIDVQEENLVVTALSTKLATRSITHKLIEWRAKNIILPFNTI